MSTTICHWVAWSASSGLTWPRVSLLPINIKWVAAYVAAQSLCRSYCYPGSHPVSYHMCPQTFTKKSGRSTSLWPFCSFLMLQTVWGWSLLLLEHSSLLSPLPFLSKNKHHLEDHVGPGWRLWSQNEGCPLLPSYLLSTRGPLPPCCCWSRTLQASPYFFLIMKLMIACRNPMHRKQGEVCWDDGKILHQRCCWPWSLSKLAKVAKVDKAKQLSVKTKRSERLMEVRHNFLGPNLLPGGSILSSIVVFLLMQQSTIHSHKRSWKGQRSLFMWVY